MSKLEFLKSVNIWNSMFDWHKYLFSAFSFYGVTLATYGRIRLRIIADIGQTHDRNSRIQGQLDECCFNVRLFYFEGNYQTR